MKDEPSHRLDYAGWGTNVPPQRPRAWNSVCLGVAAAVWVAVIPVAAGWLLPGKGQTAGLLTFCGYLAVSAVLVVSGIGSAVRSLFDGPARAVAIVGLALNLAAAAWFFFPRGPR